MQDAVNSRPSADRILQKLPQGATIALIVMVSAVVGAVIFAYGLAVRDVCRDAGLDLSVSSALAVLACSPILAALYSIDS